jgi:voltage-gated potassium channel
MNMPYPFHRFLLRYGMAGLPSTASERAREWEARLKWPLFAALCLAIPAFYIELSAVDRSLLWLGEAFVFVIAAAFASHLAIMMMLAPRHLEYLSRNWMHVPIIVGAAINLMQMGHPVNWQDWTLRLIWQGTAFIRLTGFLTGLVRPGSLGSILLLAVVTLAAAGAGFYWLEPTVQTYPEGLWLAFVSAATVGYGDFLPTTPASRIFAVFIVVLGYAVLSMVTASIAALFIGEEEKELRRQMHRDIKALRVEVAELRQSLESQRSSEK